MRFIMLLALLSLAAPPASSAVIHVPGDHATIQGAIDAAAEFDTVLVAPGTYGENIDFIGKAIIVKSSGGPGATVIDAHQSGCCVTFRTWEGPDSVIEGFTLTNGSGSAIIPVPMGGGIVCDIYAAPTIRGNIISGNTAVFGGGIACIFLSSPAIEDNIIGGNEAADSKGAGGGIYCAYSATPLISNNTIDQNKAGAYGGGIECISFASPLIRDNILSNNIAKKFGGGVDCFDAASPLIEGNLITGNSTSSEGGGISCVQNSDPMIVRNVISGNSAFTGAGVFCRNSSPTVLRTRILDNSVSKQGGGMHLEEHSSPVIAGALIAGNRTALINSFGGGICCTSCAAPTFHNTTITENSTLPIACFGGGICCMDAASPEMANSILWNNSSSKGNEIALLIQGNPSMLFIRYSDVEGAKPAAYVESPCTLDWGPGMIDADPLFVDAPGRDYHLTFPSPCKDAGDNAGVFESLDFEGDPRIAYGAADMGADEFYTHLYWTGDATPNGNIELKFVGLPGTAPVDLCIGSGVLDPPIPSMWGFWHLQFPIVGPIDLKSIPSPSGVLVISGAIPSTPPPPYPVPMQALIGAELTNPCLLEVK
jgi:nitrous oxidase accessory protein NosD